MTTNYHTPLSGVNTVDAVTFNGIFSDLDSAITTLAGVSQNTISVTLAEGVSIRDAGYIDLSSGEGYLLDANESTPKAGAVRGFWTSTVISGGTGTLQISGILSGFSGLTVGDPVYVGTTAGAITQTRPTPSSGGAQIAIMQMGIAISATEVLVRPEPIQYQLRDAMADTDTLTITHHDDVNGYRRKIWAYITELVAGAEAVGYASGNQDSDVGLKAQSPATYGSDITSSGTTSASAESADVATNATDDNTSTFWFSGTTTAPIILKHDQGAGNSAIARKYTIRVHPGSPVAAPKSWTFQGSNNDADWDTLDTHTDVSAFSAGEQREYVFDNATAYRYYRLSITKNQSDNTTASTVAEWEIMEAATYKGDKLAQTFTLGSSTDIGSVGLWLKKVGSPTGTATVRIETTSGGNPTGTLADANATATFAESTLGTSYAEKTVTFPAEFTLGAGTYAIVLSTDRSASVTNYIAWGADGSTPSYAGGEMLNEASSSWSSESKDAIFSVYEPGVSHPSRVGVDWWSSAYADMVNRYGDGSGSNLDTQTTFKCVRAAGFDDITLVVELP